MLDAQARWNIIKARARSTLTMEQLKEEIAAAERRLVEDENGIIDSKLQYDSIYDIILKGTVTIISIW